MPRGGHGRSGPAVQTAATRELHGAEQRARHREKGAAGTAMVVCAPPPGLSKQEAAFWTYYAPLLLASQRLTLESRDTLAKYCTALATVAELRRQIASRKKADLANRAANRKELRQWLAITRLYESDLLLNPAAAVRAPKPDDGSGEGDPFSEFDDPVGTH